MKNLSKAVLLLGIVVCFAGLASAQMTTTVGGFTMRLVDVTYDWDAPSSTWTYGLTWNDGYSSPDSPSENNPALSHLTIDLCDDLSPGDVTNITQGFTISYSEGASDPGDWGFVIKWDVNDGSNPVVMGEEFLFSFTLNDTYAVEPITFFAKAGSDHNQGLIYGPGCMIADPEIDVTKGCSGDVFVGDTISYDITVTNTGNVPLFDVQVSDPLAGLDENIGTLEPGASQSFNPTIPATEAGSVTNTVTASGDYFGNTVSGESSCTTTIWELAVAKTALTSYTRDWDWTLEKLVEEDAIDICGQSSATLHYTVNAARTNTDTDHNVSGTITIHNPAPIPAPLVSVTDNFDAFAIPVACGVSFPFDLPGGGYLNCTYSLDLGAATDGTNVASANLSSGTSFSGSALVTFGDPTTEIDPIVTITDTLTCPEGFECGATPFPMDIGGDASIPFDVEVTKAGAECNSYFNVVNMVSLVESDASHSSSVSTEIYTCECGYGCTLTIGYWKTHAGFTGRNEDDVTQFLPIWLGTPYATRSIEITTAAEAVEALSMSLGHPSNGITKLYAQLLAAKLNIANGASMGDVTGYIQAADNFLESHDYEDWKDLRKNEKKSVLMWMAMLDAYNNGDIGPGHCD